MFDTRYLSCTTFGDLKKSGYTAVAVKEEMRNNLIRKLRAKETLFPGIVGYTETVIPSIVNAILAKHDIILLGLRGQAKTKIVRMLPSLLDAFIPIVKGSEINDSPFAPVSKYAVELVQQFGDASEIEWIPAEQRYGEKLATPDVTIADLIGDIDPIKAATQRLHYSHEGAINFGLIPRMNRGIFAINELPDLQPRIQVGLFNIMQEKDIQIRGFNVRIPLDVMIVFTANPEDYTNRGNIITPLKDRIGSQIITHYPHVLSEAIAITEQEAWTARDASRALIIPRYMKELVEQIAFQARQSEYVDQKSGVSARLTISAMENLISNAERRAILCDEKVIMPRICDTPFILPSLTGKVELVFEGEQEGTLKVSKALIGKAVREVFKKYFPDPLQKSKARRGQEQRSETSGMHDPVYGAIVRWFESGNRIEISDTMDVKDYYRCLNVVDGLAAIVERHMKIPKSNVYEFSSAMEFVLEGLHQHSKIAKDEVSGRTSFKDLVGTLFTMKGEYEED